MIKISNMYKSYSSKYTGKQEVFKDFSIDFPSKGFVSILGKSGCGKTTLLNVIGGIDSIDKGYVNVFGYDISKYSNGNTLIDEYRKDIVGFVFQSYNLINNISVYKNLALPLEMQGYSNEEIKIKIEEVLTKVEMIEYKNRMPYELSGGQQQRVAIARALVKDSKLILADEPTGNLDSVTGTEILKLLKEISKERLVIFITHDQDYADEYSDKVININDGVIVNDYNCKETMSIKKYKIKSKTKWTMIFKSSLQNIQLNILKNILIILLLTTTVTILSVSIALLTTSEEEIIETIVKEDEDRFITQIDNGVYLDDYSGLFAVNHYFPRGASFDLYEEYKRIRDTYGSDKILLSSRVYIINEAEDDSDFFSSTNIVYRTRLNFLDADEDYEIPNLIGRMPLNGTEVIVSDLVSNLLFGTDEAIGEVLEISRFDVVNCTNELELTIVGIVKTNYAELNHNDSRILSDDFLHYGASSIPNRYYNFYEEDLYIQMYTIDSAFEDLDLLYVYEYRNVYGGVFNYNLTTYEGNKSLYGPIYSDEIIELDSLIGALPSNENEILISYYNLNSLLPNNSTEIQDLINSITTWSEFKTLVELSDVQIYYDNDSASSFYSNLIPEEMTIVGIYEQKDLYASQYDDNKIVFYKPLIRELNNATPYNDIGLSFVNSSSTFLEQLEYVTSQDFLDEIPEPTYFDLKTLVVTPGIFNLYRTYNNNDENVIPFVKTLLLGTIGFTFILLFLYSYLTTINNQKRIGIYRSIGFSRNDIFRMFIFENGFVFLTSLIIAYVASLVLIDNLNTTLFSDTIFSDLSLLRFRVDAILMILGATAGLMITTTILPLIKVLRMTPVNIINK